MFSGLLIVMTVMAGLIWGSDFLMAPQWFRIGLQISLAAVLFWAVMFDWKDGGYDE